MTSRPHTPRRFGTSHTPQAVDLLGGRRSAAADENIAGLYPEYWKNSGQAFRLRPSSAPSTRPSIHTQSVAAVSSVAAPVDDGPCVTPRVLGVLDFGKVVPRSPRHPSPHAVQSQTAPTNDPFFTAAPQISPRTRGFSMSAAPPRNASRPASAGVAAVALADAHSVPPAPPSAPRVPGFRFVAMTTRTQANFAAGFGEAPTAAYYRQILADSGAPPSVIRTNEDAEGYLQTFVDQQDHQFTVGLRGATERRAMLTIRQRTYPHSGGFHTTPAVGDASPRKSVDWKKMMGRSEAIIPSSSPPSRSSAAEVGPDAHRNYLSSVKHVPGVSMMKVTSRDAPVSTVLPMQQPSTTPASMRGPSAPPPMATDRHVRGVNIAKLRPHELLPNTRSGAVPGAQAYRIKDSLVCRKAPSAIIV